MTSGPIKHHHHFASVISLRGLRKDLQKVNGVNAKIAVFLTRIVGSMFCAYAFALLALAGLPSALHPGGEGIVAWIAQTFLQLVLLSVIMVGQSVQSAASDARAENEFADAEYIKNQVNENTDGGLKTVLDQQAIMLRRLDALAAAPTPPKTTTRRSKS